MRTNPIRTLIVDDEEVARLALTRRLQVFGDRVDICGEAADSAEAQAQIAKLKPDLVFLDIAMPGRNGLDLARQLRREDAPIVVFLTAFGNCAIDAFETDAVDYILKPVASDRLSRTLDRVSKVLEDREQIKLSGELRSVLSKFHQDQEDKALQMKRFLVLDIGDGVVRLAENDVTYIEAAGEYACVYSNDETHVVRKSLKTFEEELSSDRFLRIHRQTIVNLGRISRLVSHGSGHHGVCLDTGRELSVSRRRYSELKSVFEKTVSDASG